MPMLFFWVGKSRGLGGYTLIFWRNILASTSGKCFTEIKSERMRFRTYSNLRRSDKCI
jgi:hypothetical protein